MTLTKKERELLQLCIEGASCKGQIENVMEKIPGRSLGPVCGLGINDCGHIIGIRLRGKFIQHRGYSAWINMLKRSYDESYQARNPTYVGCSVDSRWHTFSEFKKWWKENFVDGYSIDKDLLLPGNKVYSPESCIYIPQKLNLFALDSSSIRGDWPIGVSWNAKKRKFTASIHNLEGRIVCLGYKDDPKEAHQLWLEEKIRLAKKLKPLCDSIHPNLYLGVLGKIKTLSEAA